MNISIYLGSRCNCECEYCHRQYSKLEPAYVGDKLKKILLDNKDNDLCVSFYGGEPTLYMKHIKEIVELIPDAKFIITTNGTTLDKYTEFFNQHKFKIVISYDGEHGVRGVDPFTNRINCNDVSVSSVLYHNHCSLKQLYSDINKKEQQCMHTLNSPPHIVHATRYDNVKYSLSIKEIYTLICEEQEMIHDTIIDFRLYGVLNKHGLALVDKWFKYINHNYNNDETYCCNKDSIKVDLFGDVWDCLYMRVHHPTPPYSNSRCDHCNIRKYCGCACIYSVCKDVECVYYRRMITWFLKEYEKYKEEIDEIIRISKCNEFESTSWC